MGFFTKTKKPASFNEAMRGIEANALQNAIDEGEDHGVTLDFSDKSIKDVDTVLENLRQAFIKAGAATPDEIQVARGANGFAMIFAHYLVACIERNHLKGEWADYSPPVGNIPTFVVGEQHIYPVAWCMKRLSNGAEDTLATKYDYFVSKLKT